MNSGLPPTAPNARAGLFTPPGMTRHARRNAAALLGREWDGDDGTDITNSEGEDNNTDPQPFTSIFANSASACSTSFFTGASVSSRYSSTTSRHRFLHS